VILIRLSVYHKLRLITAEIKISQCETFVIFLHVYVLGLLRIIMRPRCTNSATDRKLNWFNWFQTLSIVAWRQSFRATVRNNNACHRLTQLLGGGDCEPSKRMYGQCWVTARLPLGSVTARWERRPTTVVLTDISRVNTVNTILTVLKLLKLLSNYSS